MTSRRLSLALAVVVLVSAFGAGAVLGGYLTNSVGQTGTVPYNNSGVNISLVAPTSIDVNGTTLFPSSDTVQLNTSEGNATFTASGTVDATIEADHLDGQWTNLTNLDVTGADLTVDAEGMEQFTVGGDADAVYVRDTFTLDDGVSDFRYEGTSGTTKLTIRGLPADTPIRAVDQNDNIVGGGRSDASGVVTFASLENSNHVVTLQTGSDGPPRLSNLSPTGGQDQEPTQFSVQVNDTEFNSGDSVDVEFQLEGSTVTTNTVTNNGTTTASIPASGKSGGTHNWTVIATDASGNQDKETASYKVPDALFIRPLEAPNTRLQNVDVTVTFFGSDTVVEKNTGTNGYVNLTGLPVNEKMLVEADPPDTSDYGQRSMILDTIYQQESMYLLNTTAATTVEVRFELNDQTGRFPTEESDLVIERPVTIGGTLQWVRVDGGDFAVNGVTTDLEENQRYRLTVRNDDGDVRVLGTYKTSVSETVTLTIGTIGAAPSQGDKVPLSYNATYTANPNSNNVVEFDYFDDANKTDKLYVRIFEYNNESNVLFANKTFLGPIGTVSVSQSVSQTDENATWVVKFTYVRDGQATTVRRIVGPRRPVLESMPGWLVTLLSIGILWIVAGLFSQINGAIGGAVTASLAGMFWYVDFLPPGVGLGVVMLAMIMSGVILLRGRTGGSAP